MQKRYEYREPLEEKAWEKYGLVFWMTAVAVVFGGYGMLLDHEMNQAKQKQNRTPTEKHLSVVKNVSIR